MRLKELVEPMELLSHEGSLEGEVRSITYDSRKVEKGSLFVAIRGIEQNGHNYLDQAIDRGASALLVEEWKGPRGPSEPEILVVKDSRRALSGLAARFYGEPSKKLSLVGITGTNGKTTTAYLVESIIAKNGGKSGLISTILYRMGREERTASHTTPESLDLQSILREMVDEGNGYCVMEVSSHALEMGRVADVCFHTAVFTNLTQDHLDYHGDMESYRQAKEKLFTEFPLKSAVINIDDPAGEGILKKIQSSTLSYGIDKKADIQGKIRSLSSRGVELEIQSPSGNIDVVSSLPGRHNAYNLLAAVGVGLSLGFPLEGIKEGLAALTHVPGRLEPVDEGQPFEVLVDYAHTEDALENVLRALGEIATGRVLVLFGCGGDRDRGKRPKMGKVGVELSHYAVVTSDNPRREDPRRILDDIVAGISSEDEGSYTVIEDRRKAIGHLLSTAGEGDLLLIAGKGHEDYQILGKEKIHFDDREVAREFLREMGYGR